MGALKVLMGFFVVMGAAMTSFIWAPALAVVSTFGGISYMAMRTYRRYQAYCQRQAVERAGGLLREQARMAVMPARHRHVSSMVEELAVAPPWKARRSLSLNIPSWDFEGEIFENNGEVEIYNDEMPRVRALGI